MGDWGEGWGEFEKRGQHRLFEMKPDKDGCFSSGELIVRTLAIPCTQGSMARFRKVRVEVHPWAGNVHYWDDIELYVESEIMTQVDLLAKQKHTGRRGRQTYGYPRWKVVREGGWEIGINTHTIRKAGSFQGGPVSHTAGRLLSN